MVCLKIVLKKKNYTTAFYNKIKLLDVSSEILFVPCISKYKSR